MDSIIASQKIGKRRRAEDLRRDRATVSAAAPYRRILVESSPAPRRGGQSWQKPKLRRVGEGLSRLGRAFRRGSGGPGRDPKLRSRVGALVSRLRGLSKRRQALIAAALVLGILAIGMGIALIVRGPAFPLPTSALLPEDGSAQDLLLDYVSPELADGRADAADLDATNLPPPPVSIQMGSYTVRSGDSLASIAKRFGLYVDSLISANGISDSRSIRAGRELRIPNINGLVYKVKSGDNLAGIAKRFKTDTTKLVDANDLGSETIAIGQTLFIPGARLPKATVSQALGQRVLWPVRGPLSSYFGYRPDPFTGVRRFHAGIDIVVNMGTQVRAAMGGRVEDVGYNANYGNYVIMNHGDGFQTLYGHLSSASVSIGQNLSQGAVVGLSGNTGYSTGPHLHFGLYKRSLALNPLKYLK